MSRGAFIFVFLFAFSSSLGVNQGNDFNEIIGSNGSDENSILRRLVAQMSMNLESMNLELKELKEQQQSCGIEQKELRALLENITQSNSPREKSSSSTASAFMNPSYRTNNIIPSVEPPVIPSINMSNVHHMLKLLVRSSCYEWLQAGFTTSGMYSIDPDGLGIGEPPFAAYCDMVTGYTFVRHNMEGDREATKCTGPMCYRAKVEYTTSDTQIRALIRSSGACQQYVKVDCFESPLKSRGSILGWWKGQNGESHQYWAGDQFGDHTCQCGLLGICIDPSETCNCDSTLANVWVTDSGYITNETALPIQEVMFGSKDNYTPLQVNYRIGPLRCHGSRSLSYPTTCLDLFQHGGRRSGWYIVGQPASLRVTFCNMESLHETITEPSPDNGIELVDVGIGDLVMDQLQSKGFRILKEEQYSKILKNFKTLEDMVEFMTSDFIRHVNETNEGMIRLVNETNEYIIQYVNETHEDMIRLVNETKKDNIRHVNQVNNNIMQYVNNTVTSSQNREVELKNNINSLVETVRSNMTNLKETCAAGKTIVVFHALRKSGTMSASSIITYETVTLNEGNGYNPTTGKFTAPVPGVYHIAAYAEKYDDNDTYFWMRKNGKLIAFARDKESSQDYNTMGTAVIVDLNVGDEIDVHLRSGDIHGSTNIGDSFMGYLLYERL